MGRRTPDIIERHSTPILIPELRRFVADIGEKARDAAAEAKQTVEGFGGWQNVIVSLWLDKTYIYNRLAVDLAYVEKTRLSLLPPLGRLDIFLEPAAHTALQKFIRGEDDYSLDEFAQEPDWFKAIAAATQNRIPKAKIHKAARQYWTDNPIISALKSQIRDEEKKAEAIEVLQRSSYGRSLLQEAAEIGYEITFIDLKAYNNGTHDLGIARCYDVNAFAVCFGNRQIFVNAYNDPDDVHCAIKLGHEIAHAIQNYKYFNIGRHKKAGSVGGIHANIRQFSSMREAHSIAAEYIIATELLKAGIKAEYVHSRLYEIAPETVNYLLNEPTRFIATVSQSNLVRQLWKMQAKNMNYSPKIARGFASSLPPLAKPWEPHNPYVVVDQDGAIKRMMEAIQPHLAAGSLEA